MPDGSGNTRNVSHEIFFALIFLGADNVIIVLLFFLCRVSGGALGHEIRKEKFGLYHLQLKMQIFYLMRKNYLLKKCFYQQRTSLWIVLAWPGSIPGTLIFF